MPNDWNCDLIKPILKKGNKTKCNNYRGITLLNTMYKILTLTNLIRQKIEKDMRTKICEYQHGFREGKSTKDAIHIVTQIVEKS